MAQHLSIDSRVHATLLETIVERGHAPDLTEIAAALGVEADEVEASLGRLSENHGLVLSPGTFDVLIVHPFALYPTGAWVNVKDDAGERDPQGRGWWAPCLWCAMGIAALVGSEHDLSIHVRLGGEGEEDVLHVEGGEVSDQDIVVHFPLPPRDAWNDVRSFCAMVQPFRSAADVAGWCRRHGLPRGEIVTILQLTELARIWYGRHLDVGWRKWTAAEAHEIFRRAGLTGAFWQLDSSSERF